MTHLFRAALSVLVGVLAVAVILTETPEANAQCRVVRGGYYSQPQHYNFNYGYYNQSHVQYSTPTHYNYYTPAYVAPVVKEDYVVQKVVAQEVAVAPLIVTVPVVTHAVPIQNYGPTHYYSVQENYQQKAQIREIIREELRAWAATQGGGGGGGQQKTDPPLYQKQPPPQQQQQAPPGKSEATDLGKDTTTPPEVATKVLKAFKDSTCLSCHGSSAQGNLKLAYDDNTLAKQSRERRWMVYGQASTGVMPPAARNDANKAMKQEYLPDVLRWVLQAGD